VAFVPRYITLKPVPSMLMENMVPAPFPIQRGRPIPGPRSNQR
jgi:hypothetical protein